MTPAVRNAFQSQRVEAQAAGSPLLKPKQGKRNRTVSAASTASTAAPASPMCAPQLDLPDPIEPMLEDTDSIMLLFGSRGKQLKTSTEKVGHSDGTTWLVTRGPPPPVSVIENQLEEVKKLFSERHPGYPTEAPKSNQAPIMKPGAWSVCNMPRGCRAFCSRQFSQATRSDRKQRKMDWLQGRVNAPIVDCAGTEAHEAFMDAVATTRRYNTEPTNERGRRLRRSTRFQAAVRHGVEARTREQWKCKTERAVRRDRRMLLLTHGEVVL